MLWIKCSFNYYRYLCCKKKARTQNEDNIEMKPSSAYGIHKHSMVSEDSIRATSDHYQYEAFPYEESKPQFEDTAIYEEPFQ